MPRTSILLLLASALVAAPNVLASPLPQGPTQPGYVLAQTKISETEGGFTGDLSPFDGFGRALARIGDLDGDGIADLAVGAPFDDDGGLNPGAVWILFLNADGSVRESTKIGLGSSGFPGTLEAGSQFGAALAALGDLDGDGVPDLAVGAPGRNDGGSDRGVVWIFFLDPDGSIKSAQKISSTDGGLVGPIQNGDLFGSSLGTVGDFDGDGQVDLVVGAIGDKGGGLGRGAVWLLFLGTDGRVDSERKLAHGVGGFGGALADFDAFGSAAISPGDIDDDGNLDLVVGAVGYDPAGAVWVLFLDADGTVREEVLISDATGDFMGALAPGDGFGISICPVGDVNGDGVPDFATGAYADDDGGSGKGAVWVVFLNPDGTVDDQQKISATTGGFGGDLGQQDAFGYALGDLVDFDGDGRRDIAVTAFFDDDGGLDQGACYLVFLDSVLPPAVFPYAGSLNPTDSMTVVSGKPSIGTTMIFGLENPFGTQAPGSATAVIASLEPDPAFPAGTLFPGWGMSAPGSPGELLVSLGQPDLVLLLAGPPWGGVGSPALVHLSVPNNPALLGLSVFLQGVIADPAASQGVGPAWTSAFELRIGP